MSISSPRTPWPTAPTCATSARTTTAARRLIRRSSRNCSGRRSRTRNTRPTCSPGRWRRWTGSLPGWATGWKSAGAPTPPGLPTRTLSTCPPWRPGCVPAPQQDPLSKYLYENLSPETQQLLAGQGNEARLRRSLAEDLNLLLERELKIKQQPQGQEAGEGRGGPGNRRRQHVRAAAQEAGAARHGDCRAVQDRPALRAGALQAGAAFGIPGGFHQGEPAELDPHPAEPPAAGSGLPEGNRPEPGRRLPGPRNLHRHARGLAALLPGIPGRCPEAHAARPVQDRART